MARLEFIPDDLVSEESRLVLDEIKAVMGMVPNLFRAYAAHPALLRTNWAKYKALMTGGDLDRKVKEAIALLVSVDNGCEYCIDAHTQGLRLLGVKDEELQNVTSDLAKTSFTQKEMNLISFARSANKDPNSIPDSAFEALKREGASESEILEALGVMELYAGFNKFLDSVKVDRDFRRYRRAA